MFILQICWKHDGELGKEEAGVSILPQFFSELFVLTDLLSVMVGARENETIAEICIH